MVRCEYKDRGLVIECKGSLPVIQGEVEELLRSLRLNFEKNFDKDIAKELMNDMFKNAMMSEEERKKAIDEEISNHKEEYDLFKRFLHGDVTEADKTEKEYNSINAFMNAMFGGDKNE